MSKSSCGSNNRPKNSSHRNRLSKKRINAIKCTFLNRRGGKESEFKR